MTALKTKSAKQLPDDDQGWFDYYRKQKGIKNLISVWSVCQLPGRLRALATLDVIGETTLLLFDDDGIHFIEQGKKRPKTVFPLIGRRAFIRAPKNPKAERWACQARGCRDRQHDC